MTEPLDFNDPDGSKALARVRRGLSDKDAALVDALSPEARRYLLWSLEHARLVSSHNALVLALSQQAPDGMTSEASEIVARAYELAHERLFRAGPVTMKSKTRRAA